MADAAWMINPNAGIMSVPEHEVQARKGQGWTECDDSGKSLNAPKPEPTPKSKKKDK